MDPRVAAFRRLHESGCFVIPNPWDVGSARVLARLGFRALASTSAGFAFSEGEPDQPVPAGADPEPARDRLLGHLAALARATELPVNADFQAGYAREPAGVADSVRLCVATGVAGLSIEDLSGEPAHPLFELPVAVERLRAARAAIDASGSGVLLTGRAECFLIGHPDPLRESLRRLEAYAAAGADVLYAPGVVRPDDIAAIVRAVAPKPVNLLVSRAGGLSVAQAAELGVRRVSVGSALARVAWGAFVRAARELAEQGSFGGLEAAISFPEINALFRPA